MLLLLAYLVLMRMLLLKIRYCIQHAKVGALIYSLSQNLRPCVSLLCVATLLICITVLKQENNIPSKQHLRPPTGFYQPAILVKGVSTVHQTAYTNLM